MTRNARGWSLVCSWASLFLGASALSAPRLAEAAPQPELVVTQQLTTSLGPADPATRSRVNEWIEAAGTGWRPNLGQIADADGRVANRTTAAELTHAEAISLGETRIRQPDEIADDCRIGGAA